MNTTLLSPDFSKNSDGLLPAIIQDAHTGNVLMLGYFSETSLRITLETKKVTFFSRSKQRLWTKGEESGNFLFLEEIKLDCDKDTFLVKVSPNGPTCHNGTDTCWAEQNTEKFGFLHFLSNIIQARKAQPSEKSYTSQLFAKGINKVAQKVGEEAVELVIEAKDNNNDLFKNEAADLLFHFLILLEQKNIPLNDVLDMLKSRHHK
ncbi:MAG: bifunctional phosphoribosyl-AMP cyclohydrolase/phosphoribosyl-ATP diphosphatase HisIE [Chitinophagales bacterium]|nr:bifunctional phosphoribosyl-AMP cyclohydrolase/phosphoribosyl-ATP diphosphatase HisIE [Chitinophagales bacterium]